MRHCWTVEWELDVLTHALKIPFIPYYRSPSQTGAGGARERA